MTNYSFYYYINIDNDYMVVKDNGNRNNNFINHMLDD